MLALTVLSTLELQDLYKEIEKDETIQKLIRRFKNEEQMKAGFTLVNERLFFKNKLVIPANSRYIQLILQECHDSVMGGHAGVLRTLQRVWDLFYWPKMRKRVQEYVAACSVCQTHKSSTLSPAGLL